MTTITPQIQQYTVDFASNNNFLFIKGVQGDGYGTRYADISLMNNGQPYEIDKNEVCVVIRGTKPDNCTIFNECEILDSCTIRVEITQQMAAVAGKGNYEVSVMSLTENRTLTSFPFFVMISESTFDVGYVTSSDEFQLLISKINQVDQVNKIADALVAQQEELKVQLEETIATSEHATEKSIEATTACVDATNDMRALEGIVETAEAERIANENIRIANETQRIENENNRQQQALDFAAAEAIRVEQEADRQTNTATAIANAESATQNAIGQTTVMQNLENTVSQNEAVRQANEKVRETNEDLREDLHGVMQELENTVSNNEETRQQQESERQTNTATAITNAEEATAAAWDAIQHIQEALGIDDSSISYGSTWSSKKISEQTKEWFWRKSINNITISPSDWSDQTVYIKSDAITEDSVIDIYFNAESLQHVAECDLRYSQGSGYICIHATYLPYMSITIDAILIENYSEPIVGTLSSSL